MYNDIRIFLTLLIAFCFKRYSSQWADELRITFDFTTSNFVLFSNTGFIAKKKIDQHLPCNIDIYHALRFFFFFFYLAVFFKGGRRIFIYKLNFISFEDENKTYFSTWNARYEKCTYTYKSDVTSFLIIISTHLLPPGKYVPSLLLYLANSYLYFKSQIKHYFP